MSLVLVLIVASLALADAGYQYEAPSAILSLSGNQPANFHSGHNSQYHTSLPHSISYKDYVYLKQDNGHNIGNHGSVNHGISNSGIVTAPSVQPTAENNGYANAGYEQSFAPAPTVNLNNNYAQNYAPVNNRFNSDHIQNILPITSNANIGYAQNTISFASDSLSTGYSQASLASADNNLNNGYTHTSVPVNKNFDNAQIFTSSANTNLNTGYSNGWVPVNSGLSHGHANAAIPTASSNLNTGYSQPLATSGATSYSNSYGQTSISSTSGNIIDDYSQAVTTSGSGHSNLDNGGNLDNDYSHTLVPYNLNIGFTKTDSNNDYNGNTNTVSISSSAPVTPTVFKHIYLHVPPPETEEQNVNLPPPVKKNYKILFIKLPSQESNLARLKQIAQLSNAAASVEHKTLIYVLAKSPETQQPVFIPNRTPSEHEVFFVKYNGNPLDIAAQVNAELDKSGTVQSVVPLESDLVNGKK